MLYFVQTINQHDEKIISIVDYNNDIQLINGFRNETLVSYRKAQLTDLKSFDLSSLRVMVQDHFKNYAVYLEYICPSNHTHTKLVKVPAINETEAAKFLAEEFNKTKNKDLKITKIEDWTFDHALESAIKDLIEV